jgi:hypothetical protein
MISRDYLHPISGIIYTQYDFSGWFTPDSWDSLHPVMISWDTLHPIVVSWDRLHPVKVFNITSTTPKLINARVQCLENSLSCGARSLTTGMISNYILSGLDTPG